MCGGKLISSSVRAEINTLGRDTIYDYVLFTRCKTGRSVCCSGGKGSLKRGCEGIGEFLGAMCTIVLGMKCKLIFCEMNNFCFEFNTS